MSDFQFLDFQIIQEKVDEIRWEIKKIEEALDKPVIDYSYFEDLATKDENTRQY